MKYVDLLREAALSGNLTIGESVNCMELADELEHLYRRIAELEQQLAYWERRAAGHG